VPHDAGPGLPGVERPDVWSVRGSPDEDPKEGATTDEEQVRRIVREELMKLKDIISNQAVERVQERLGQAIDTLIAGRPAESRQQKP
jgi:hypothetical protein